MSVVALEGIVDGGVVRPRQPITLANGTRVYIIVPEAEAQQPRIESPRLVHPEQQADFGMEVSKA
jgi:hypothetical protein